MSINYSAIVMAVLIAFSSVMPASLVATAVPQDYYQQLKEKAKVATKKLKKYMPSDEGYIALAIIAVVLAGSYGWRWYQNRLDQAEYSDGLKAADIKLIFTDDKKAGKSILKPVGLENKNKKTVTWFDGKTEL